MRTSPESILLNAYAEHFGTTDGVLIARAPGRVNLIGDHTDYNDGFVLPSTIDRAVYVAASKWDDDSIEVISHNFGNGLVSELGDRGLGSGEGWETYVGGVVREYAKRGKLDSGFRAVIYGNVPLGAGLSSSAAIAVATAIVLQAVFKFEQDPVEMARTCQHVEHTYAGVRCGIMDQFASRLGKADHALFLDCRSLAYEHIPLPLAAHGLSVVIVNSGVSRELTASSYNERRSECEAAVDHFRREDPSITALRDVSPALLRAGHELPEHVFRRARHVVSENERVLKTRDAALESDWDCFGKCMFESHRSLQIDYEVSTPEIDALVELARATDGVVGARITGAGFGGCTVNLVRRDSVEDLKRGIEEHYPGKWGHRAEIYVVEHNLDAQSYSASFSD